MYQVTGNEKLYIIELKMYSELSNIHTYSLYVDDERPIYFNNSPILFFDLSSAEKALKISNCGAKKIVNFPECVDCIYDYYSVMQILENSNIKYVVNSNLIGCLNLLADYCFDTMDFWTDSKKERERLADEEYKLHPPDEPTYMVPVVPNRDIKEECDFFRKIFSAAMYFTTETDIDQHFINEGYERGELVKAMKYLIGHIVVSSIYIR